MLATQDNFDIRSRKMPVLTEENTQSESSVKLLETWLRAQENTV